MDVNKPIRTQMVIDYSDNRNQLFVGLFEIEVRSGVYFYKKVEFKHFKETYSYNYPDGLYALVKWIEKEKPNDIINLTRYPFYAK